MLLALFDAIDLSPSAITRRTLWSRNARCGFDDEHRLVAQRHNFVAGAYGRAVGGMAGISALDPPLVVLQRCDHVAFPDPQRT